ncbi:MAG: hypothetical protein ACP6IP_05120 [Candidatus Njordarchaeia archaeon]
MAKPRYPYPPHSTWAGLGVIDSNNGLIMNSQGAEGATPVIVFSPRSTASSADLSLIPQPKHSASSVTTTFYLRR